MKEPMLSISEWDLSAVYELLRDGEIEEAKRRILELRAGGDPLTVYDNRSSRPVRS